MNIGIQREIRHGMVFSADYLRNIETRSLLGIDVNHVGDVGHFDATAATAAITDTNAAFGCPPGSAGINCAILAGAGIADYADHFDGFRTAHKETPSQWVLAAEELPCAIAQDHLVFVESKLHQ